MSLFTFLCYFAIDTNCLHLRSSNTAKIDLKGKKTRTIQLTICGACLKKMWG